MMVRKYIIIILLSLFMLFINAAADNTPNNVVTSETRDTFVKTNSLNFNAHAIGESKTAKGTDIIVSKKLVQYEDDALNIELGLKMPPKPAKLDIVLAMDTSGSMIQNYYSNGNTNVSYMKWASDSIDAILNETPDARVSIVSWDDDEDNKDFSSSFYDIRGNESLIKEILDNLSQECLETDHTVYSVGIKKAVQQLDSEKPSDPYNTSRIIIFVTGLSEFMPEPKNALINNLSLEEQLLNASMNRTYGIENKSFFGYQIYPVQIGISGNFACEADNISKISRITRISSKLPSNDNISIGAVMDLGNAINEILERQKSMPLAYNIEITDCLYPYLNPVEYASIVTMKNGSIRYVNTTVLSQNPPAFRWNIDALSGEDKWNATLRTRINLDLPIDVSEGRRPVKFSVENPKYISRINYTWMTGYNESIIMPQGRLEINSSDQSKVSTNAESSENRQSEKQPGFDALLAIIGLSVGWILYYKKAN